MTPQRLAFSVIGLEALALALLGTLAFLYLRPVAERKNNLTEVQPRKVPAQNQTDTQTFAASYQKDSKTVGDLIAALTFRPQVDLIVFVIDTSGSMQDDRQDLRENVSKILKRYKNRTFELVDYADTAQITGEPTRDLAEIQRRLDNNHDLGGTENSFQALVAAASKAREKFKYPAVILMTDAAPNDLLPGGSYVTMEQAAEALNAANVELHVFAAFDAQEYLSGGSAGTSSLYPELVDRTKAGGKVYMVNRGGFDSISLRFLK